MLPGGNSAGRDLDRQAISKGLLPDPSQQSFAGRFETRSDLGTDKFCAIDEGGNYRFGMLAVFGPESKCEGTGTAEPNGDHVKITFAGKDSCTFDAEFDGVVLRFPGKIGKGCASYCSARASMSGTRYYLVEPGNDSARRTLGREIESLCR